jgi:cell division septal protein FtsQ
LLLFIKIFVAKPPSSSSTWKAIEQPKLKRGNTPQAREKKVKRFLKGLLAIIAMAALIGCGWVALQGYQFVVHWVSRIGPSQPLSQVVFESNGVLNKSWLEKSMALPWGIPLLSVDIADLKMQLQSHGQIAHATVERLFPNTLKIGVEELQPIARILLRESTLRSSIYLVSKEGCIYKGEAYPTTVLEHLPFLEGVLIKKDLQGNLLPLPGMEPIEALLTLARNHYPTLYKCWKSISLERFKGNPDVLGAALEVKTHENQTVLFSPQKPLDQLQRLDYIAQYALQQGKPFPRRVDLTLEDQAAVEFALPTKTASSKRSKP